MLNQFSRTQLVYGRDAMEILADSRVAVFGIGGVGGYTVEALARSGVGKLDLIDDDKVCLTNVNRQILATLKTVGQYKVDVAEERIHSINPQCEVRTYKTFYMPDTEKEFDFTQYDYIVDAIDTVKDTLRGFVDMMPGMEPNRAEMLKAAQAGFPTATDLADYLTKKGLPFRESHDVVGSVVRLASERDCDLAELPLEELRKFTKLIDEDVYEKALKLEACVAARDHVGGTAPNQVRFQVARWNDIFEARHAEPKPYNALNALLGL